MSIAAGQTLRPTSGTPHAGQEAPTTDLLVATDSEGILGIGDQGVGGMGDRDRQARGVHAGVGIHPHRVLPVVLDVGTDNLSLLNDAVDSGLRSLRKPVSAAYHSND
jgi:malate dehydrogenase (oxaloacetate-decarboxylating)